LDSLIYVETLRVITPNEANLVKFTKAQWIFNREHVNRPLGEYQKSMIDGVLFFACLCRILSMGNGKNSNIIGMSQSILKRVLH